MNLNVPFYDTEDVIVHRGTDTYHPSEVYVVKDGVRTLVWPLVSPDYDGLKITATANTTLTIPRNTVYNVNGTGEWVTALVTDNVSLFPGQFVFIRHHDSNTGIRSVSGSVTVSGSTKYLSSCDYLFNSCAAVRDASGLICESTSTYRYMFQDCYNLISAPSLPSVTLSTQCYQGMFMGCTSLVNVPLTLPSRTLPRQCYFNMFRGCISLVAAPRIDAEILSEACCAYMFQGCTSLQTTQSILLPLTLADSCYNSMYKDCSSLTNPPALPATSLVVGCYEGMFSGTSVTYIELDADSPGTHCNGMFSGVTSEPSTHGGIHMISEDPAIKSVIYDAWQSTIPYSWRLPIESIYLAIIVDEPGKVTLPYTYTNLESSLNSEVDWVSRVSRPSINCVAGDVVYVRAEGKSNSSQDPFTFTSNVRLAGHLSGLHYTSESTNQYFGYFLFYGCTTITDAHDLHIEAGGSSRTGDTKYTGMFQGCTSLTRVPQVDQVSTSNTAYGISMFLRCISLTSVGYNDNEYYGVSNSMFRDCTSLIKFSYFEDGSMADLGFYGCTNLTTVESPTGKMHCVHDHSHGLGASRMFAGCTHLVSVPNIEYYAMSYAQSEEQGCFYETFLNCYSLVTPPSITCIASDSKAITSWGFYGMFLWCTSLTSTPDLTQRLDDRSSTRDSTNVFDNMFMGCTSLNSARVRIRKGASTSKFSTVDMFNGVASNGTLYADFTDRSVWSSSNLPSTWSIEPIS